MEIPADGGDWENDAALFFTSGLNEGRLNAFVADHPSEPDHLISCGIGIVFPLMPSSWLPSGRMGYLQWFCTEPEWRRQGLATEILRLLLVWFDVLGTFRIQLHASEKATGIYRTAGFEDTLFPNLWLRR